MRIALFGGSFDPPHLGHVLCATYALSVAEPDAVWVLPVHQHPWHKPLSPFAQRLELARLAFAPLSRVEVRDDEQHNPSGYTWDLLDHLDTLHPGTSWMLIGGSDTARDLPRWHRGGELARRVSIIPVPRRGFDADPAALPEISSSQVRAQLAAGANVDSLVPAKVLRRIVELGAYRD